MFINLLILEIDMFEKVLNKIRPTNKEELSIKNNVEEFLLLLDKSLNPSFVIATMIFSLPVTLSTLDPLELK